MWKSIFTVHGRQDASKSETEWHSLPSLYNSQTEVNALTLGGRTEFMQSQHFLMQSKQCNPTTVVRAADIESVSLTTEAVISTSLAVSPHS